MFIRCKILFVKQGPKYWFLHPDNVLVHRIFDSSSFWKKKTPVLERNPPSPLQSFITFGFKWRLAFSRTKPHLELSEISGLEDFQQTVTVELKIIPQEECINCCKTDRYGVVAIATCYGLDGPGIESRCERNFPYPSRPALRPMQSPVQ